MRACEPPRWPRWGCLARAAFAGPGAGPDAEPTDGDTAQAAALTACVEDAGLRAALTRLGANVLARGRGRPSE
jgi:hypothetical protein